MPATFIKGYTFSSNETNVTHTKLNSLVDAASIMPGTVDSTDIANNGVNLATKVAGVLSINNGGTNATAPVNAFNNLSPLTAKGDILTRDTNNNIRLPIGTDGQALVADSAQTTGLKWSFISPTGSVILYAGSSAPSGWLFCDGSAVSRTTYAALFAAIGTTFGAGDGSTTFNLPDTRGKTPIGAGAGTGLTPRTLGQNGGEEKHQLTVDELAKHIHTDKGATPQAPALHHAEGYSPMTQI